MDAIIGYTGFVGSNLVNQRRFDFMFNSKNISEITNHEYDIVVCAGISSLKWMAIKDPVEDFIKIENLIESIRNVKCNRFVLISTIDVYEKTSDNPNLSKCTSNHHAYGVNRCNAEDQMKKIFGEKLLIIRLPAVFGRNLKKNVLFDLLNNNIRGKINLCDKYQWYNIKWLCEDLGAILGSENLSEINLFSEPIMLKEIVETFFDPDPDKTYHDCDTATTYNLNSGIEKLPYWSSKKVIMIEIKTFIKQHKIKL